MITRSADHFYYHEPSKIYVPSVTKVLDIISKGEHFNNWLKKNGANSDKKRDEAGDFGSNMHNILETIGKGISINLDGLTPLQRRLAQSFITWKEKNVKRFICTEHSLVTPDYGGTMDAGVELLNGKTALLDYKTGFVADTVDLQLSAYDNADHLNTGRNWDELLILGFDKREETSLEKTLTVREVKDRDYKFEMFMCALRLWNWKNADKLKEVNCREAV